MSPHFRIRPIRVISVSMPLPRALPVTLLLVAAACADSAPQSLASERDSAGVRIVENPVPDASVPQWSLSAEPTVVLGDLDGSEQEQFGNMIDVRRLTSGELVVSDASSYQVRVFDSTGQWLRTLGQRGEGPGDFSLVAGLLAGDDDAISAWDIRQRRITRFTPDWNVIGLLQVERPAMVTDGMGHAFTPSASPIARLGDGTYLARGRAGMLVRTEESRLHPDSLVVWHVDSGGGVTELQRHFVGESYEYYFEAGSFWFGDRPYGRKGSLAPASDGWYHTDGSEFVVNRFDLAAVQRQSYRIERERRPISASDRARVRQAEIDIEQDSMNQRRVADAMDWVDWPERMPAYDALAIDAPGNVWARVFPDSAVTSSWDVLAPDGHLVATVDVPADLAVRQIGEDWVLGIRTGEMGEQLVVLYSLSKP